MAGRSRQRSPQLVQMKAGHRTEPDLSIGQIRHRIKQFKAQWQRQTPDQRRHQNQMTLTACVSEHSSKFAKCTTSNTFYRLLQIY